ncbi:uncharacterized protein LOC108961509 [Serinus canaria]|uniref:uncharacterized protein LOC108961509 n=1 Tax=Serinus canaria TaxID=9135 RepID=UPI0021CD0DAC|nr:uncharacterized protein LOC108961509 [Serinus canaria]
MRAGCIREGLGLRSQGTGTGREGTASGEGHRDNPSREGLGRVRRFRAPLPAGPWRRFRCGRGLCRKRVRERRREAPGPPRSPRAPRDPRGTPAAMAGQAQVSMAFEDVAVLLSRAEWDALTAGQRELYRDVVSDTYELLTSLGYPGPKPDILHRLERGEEPWICSSPGHAGSWLEEPSSGWWPSASGYQGLETSCPAGWSTLWCLQDKNFQKLYDCHEGRSEFPSEADSGVGSQAQPWPVKEEVEDKPGPMEDLTHSGTIPLHSMMEQQSLHPWEEMSDGPGERNHGNAQNHGHNVGEATLLLGTQGLRVEERRAAVAKDHGYCLRSEPGTPCTPRLCCLWEHNYCQQRWDGGSREAAGSREAGGSREAAGSREAGGSREAAGSREAGGSHKAGGSREAAGSREAGRSSEGSTLQAVRRRLARRQSHWRRTFRRAREILRHYQPYWRLGFPWRDRSSSGGATQGTKPRVCPPTDAAAPRQLQHAGNAEGVTLDARRAPEGILGTGSSPPAQILDAGVGKEVKPLEHPGARQELEGYAELQKSQEVSLQDVFRNVLKAVRYILDSLCQKFELQGVSRGKSIWPIIIQIDNLTEIRKL